MLGRAAAAVGSATAASSAMATNLERRITRRVPRRSPPDVEWERSASPREQLRIRARDPWEHLDRDLTDPLDRVPVRALDLVLPRGPRRQHDRRYAQAPGARGLECQQRVVDRPESRIRGDQQWQ